MSTVDIFGTLMACQMFLENKTSASTIQFFNLVYPAFNQFPDLSITKMSELAFMSPQAGSVHVHRLERMGYLNRVHFKGWNLNPKQIVHPVLTLALRNDNTLAS